MTVTVYPSPGGGVVQSTRYTATVNEVVAHCHGRSQVCPALRSLVWNAGATVECSWVQFAANETASVDITRLAGPITSAIVYPGDKGITQAIVGGVLELQVPPNVRARVEINGDRVHAMHVFSSPLPAAVGASTDWTAYGPRTVSGLSTGTELFTFAAPHGFVASDRVRINSSTGVLPTASGGDLSEDVFYYVVADTATTLYLSRTPGGAAINITSIGGGSLTVYPTNGPAGTLYFGPGSHRIGRLFKPAAGSRLYLAGGAVVWGTVDLRGLDGVIVEGHGVLDMGVATAASAAPLPFEQRIEYVGFLGYDGSKFTYTNVVRGITAISSPFYLTFEGVTSWTNVQVLHPWDYECDGFDCSASPALTGSATDSFAFVGDDSMRLDSNWFSMTCTNVFTVNSSGCHALFGYWGGNDVAGITQRVVDCDAMQLCVADGNGAPNLEQRGANASLKLWVDNREGEKSLGRFRITVDGLNIWGPMPTRLFSIENFLYPFNAGSLARGAMGQAKDITIRDVITEQAPGQISFLRGHDAENGPRDIYFSGVLIAGERLTAANWDSFVAETRFHQNIYAEGKPVVTNEDVCNQALSHIGDAAVVTSYSPPDGSAQSLLCAQFLPPAVHDLLELHNWSFAMRREELVLVTDEAVAQDPWPYVYEVPSGMLRLLGVSQPGAGDDYESKRPVGRYEMMQGSDGVVYIYSDVPEAVARFTAYVTAPGAWPPLFRQAVSWHLAGLLAGSIIKGEQGAATAQRCAQMAQGYVSRAAASGANQRNASLHQEHAPEWIRARGVNRTGFRES